MRRWAVALAVIISVYAPAQQTTTSFLQDAEEFNKARFFGVTGGIAAGAGLSLILLNQYWYANYPRNSFHFFEDSREWLQIDKASHAFNSYYMSMWASELYQWSGVKRKTADFIGAATGSILLLTVEVLDGFSAKWGASIADFGANVLGAGFFLGQQLLFNEQRIRMKVSAFPQSYDDFHPEVQERASELFGNTFMETVIKDYNASTLWLSLSMNSIMGWDKWPAWLNLAFGYGAQNLFGGFQNRWCDDPLISPEDCQPTMLIDYSHIPRYRQWYLAPDIDLSRLNVHKPGLKFLLGVLNIIKVPTPALEYNRLDGLRFHVLYF